MLLIIQGGISMIVQHNMSSMNANRQLGISGGQLQKSTEKLSSGYRINRAGDDAAGLAISEKMRGQIRGLNQASTNSENGISMIQTAEGALQESQNILQRMRELAVQASNDTNTNDDRTQIQNEITQLTQEVDRIANTSEFNTKKLLNGDLKGSIEKKDGTASVEGTFKNGYVSVKAPITASALAAASADDVIRITLKKDVTTTTLAATDLDIKSLNATGSTATFAANAITVNGVKFDMEGTDKLKAGDVITISTTKKIAFAAQEAGKESVRLQAGANSGQEIVMKISSMKAKDLGIVQSSTTKMAEGTAEQKVGLALDVTTQSNASMAIKAYDKALEKISTERAKMGAIQNRLEHTIANLDTSGENLQAAESRIRDVNMAQEMTQYSKNNILLQAGQSMLSQANQSTQGVLSLLR